MPKISVIIPTYNRSNYLLEAIGSILNQSSKDFEIIVVDDGSTDNTREVMNKYNRNIRYFYQENKGVSAARNTGAANSKADYILFLDSDDTLALGALKRFGDIISANSSYKIICGTALKNKSFRVNNIDFLKTKQWALNDFFESTLRGKVLLMGQFVISKTFFNEIGGFKEDLIYGEDWEFLLRLSKSAPLYFIPEVFVIKGSNNEPRNYDHKVDKMVDERLKIIYSSDYLKEYCIERKGLLKEITSDWYWQLAQYARRKDDSKKYLVHIVNSLTRNPFQLKIYISIIRTFLLWRNTA